MHSGTDWEGWLKLSHCSTCPNLMHSRGKCRLLSPEAKKRIESWFPISWMDYLITEQSKRSRAEICASLNPVDILWKYLPNKMWKQRWFIDMSGTQKKKKIFFLWSTRDVRSELVFEDAFNLVIVNSVSPSSGKPRNLSVSHFPPLLLFHPLKI